MEAEIITIGDEILIGQVIDTNSAWLGERLGREGIRITRITSIQDSADAIRSAFDEALSRTGLVLVTGGLGPTKDDITKTTLAEYFDAPLERHPGTYEFLGTMIRERGMRFNELNRKQADLPRGCTVLPNRRGTAAGMWFDRNGKVLVSMPGVPYEMKGIVEEELIPRLRERFPLEPIVHKTALVYGIPESELAIRLEKWENDLPGTLKLAYLPNPGGIRLRLSAYTSEHTVAEKLMEERFQELSDLLGDHFLGFEGASVERTVAELLTRRGETLGIAESCTGGALTARFTAMPGSSIYLIGGIVAYSNIVKEKLLGVKAETLAAHGAVSRETAEEMAQGIRRLTGADYGISTTGIAGPEGGSTEKPVGTVWMAVAGPEGVVSGKKTFGPDRSYNIQRASAHTTGMLRNYLEKK